MEGGMVPNLGGQLDTSGKRDPWLRNCPHYIVLSCGFVCRAFSLLLVDVGGSSTLWAAASLGTWARAV